MTIDVPEGSDLASLLMNNRAPGTIFALGPGCFPLRGGWQYPDYLTLADGCTLQGSGVDRTILRLAETADRSTTPGGADQGDRSLNPLWVGAGCKVCDLTIDGNQSAFDTGDPSTAWFVSSGLRSVGGGLTASRLRIMGLRGAYDWQRPGTHAEAIETFGISTTSDTSGGSLIEDIEFSNIPPNAYFSAIFLGQVADANGMPPTRSVVQRIRSVVGEGNWLTLAGGINIEFRSVVASGHQIGFYNDTGKTDIISVTDLVCTGVQKAVSLIAKSSDRTSKTGVTLSQSVFIYALVPPPELGESNTFNQYGVELWDQGGGANTSDPDGGPRMGGIQVSDCLFWLRAWPGPGAAPQFYLASVLAPRLTPAISANGPAPVSFRNCLAPAGYAVNVGPGTTPGCIDPGTCAVFDTRAS